MTKRPADGEGSEGKRVCETPPPDEEINTETYSKMFFSGEQVDDVFAIRKEWWGGNSLLEIYFQTREMAESFLELVRKRDKVDGDKYSVQMLRRAEGYDEELCKALIMERPINRT